MSNSQTATIKDLTKYVDSEYFAGRIDTDDYLFHHAIIDLFFKSQTK